MINDRRFGGLILTLFFCSGATALVYEVVWSKYLSQMFGSTIYAQTVVLAVFMGGLALGNRLFGGRSDGLLRPLRTYGIIEITIGVYAFFFHDLYQLADHVFVAAGSEILDQRWLLLGLKAGLSIALLIVPTVLMGGTLPLLAAWLQKSSSDAGRRSARFYSVNSLGAVFGAGVAGFFLIQNLGMVASLQATALANVVIGGLAMGLGRREMDSAAGQPATGTPMSPSPEISNATLRWAGGLVATTGGVSMGLEVLASRSLALIFGSSLQAFAIVLMAFILGIGLGSAAIASPRWQKWRSERLVVFLLLGAAAWLGIIVFKIEWWVQFYRLAKSGLGRSEVGYLYNQGTAAFLAMIVLGVPAAMLGSVLPLLIRAVSGQTAALGERVGRLLTCNTLGAVVGVLFTGFFLMPTAGLRNSFGVLAAVLCCVAFITAWRERVPKGVFLSGLATGLVVLLFVFEGEGWRHIMSSGAFRKHEVSPDMDALLQRQKHIKILFYEDAADATVSVESGLSSQGDFQEVGLRVNGKPDASSFGDLSTQLLVGHLPLIARPNSKDVFVLGLGSGITGGAVLGHSLERLVIAENCEPVIRAARFFEKWNQGVLTDPRCSIRLEDARTVLKLSPQQYDVIITQPSNPWTAGVGSVFSREYYELAASRLKEGGVMAQWFHLYDMHDGIVAMVLRTFGSVFPYLEIWDTGTGDIVMLGSKKAWSSGLSDWQKIFEIERARLDLARIGLKSVQQLAARQCASQRTAFAIAGDGAVQSDLFPVLEYEAPKAFYLGITSRMLSRFDERTRQSELASSEQLGALGSLNNQQLVETFAVHQTINHELLAYVTWRMKTGTGPNDLEPPELRSLPCAFRSATAAVSPAGPGRMADNSATASQAAALLDGDPARRAEGVNLIESMLRETNSKDAWPAGQFASRAARVSLVSGNTIKSRILIQLGLQREPNNSELQYLSRILDRQQPSAPKLSSTQ